jgi:hypothetical protein
VLNLQLGEIQLGLGARQQSDARAFRREPDGQPLADAATRPRNQDCLVL